MGGGGAISFGPAIFPFCSPPPLPVINDQSRKRCVCGGGGGGRCSYAIFQKVSFCTDLSLHVLVSILCDLENNVLNISKELPDF